MLPDCARQVEQSLAESDSTPQQSEPELVGRDLNLKSRWSRQPPNHYEQGSSVISGFAAVARHPLWS